MEWFCADVVAHLAFGEQQHDGAAPAITDRMELGVRSQAHPFVRPMRRAFR